MTSAASVSASVSGHRRRPEGPLNVVTLRLGGELLAIPTRNLREVLEPVAITPVPNAAAFCAGLINVRGAVVPLADLRVPFGMAAAPVDENTRILVLELPLDGQTLAVGILADGVQEVTEIAADRVESLPVVGSRWPAQFVHGIARIAAASARRRGTGPGDPPPAGGPDRCAPGDGPGPAPGTPERQQAGADAGQESVSGTGSGAGSSAGSGDSFVMLPNLDAIFASYLDRQGGRASPDKGADR